MIKVIPTTGLVVGNAGMYSKNASDVFVVVGVLSVAVAVAVEVTACVIFLRQEVMFSIF
jgi:hypothetical protein